MANVNLTVSEWEKVRGFLLLAAERSREHQETMTREYKATRNPSYKNLADTFDRQSHEAIALAEKIDVAASFEPCPTCKSPAHCRALAERGDQCSFQRD